MTVIRYDVKERISEEPDLIAWFRSLDVGQDHRKLILLALGNSTSQVFLLKKINSFLFGSVEFLKALAIPLSGLREVPGTLHYENH